jgi:hypothetical protein
MGRVLVIKARCLSTDRSVLICLACNRWPLSRHMQHSQDTDRIASNVINQNVVPVRNQLACPRNPARSSQARMVNQVFGLIGKQGIKRQCRNWTISSDVLADCLSVFSRRPRPDQSHKAELAILRLVSARQISASASTSSEETRSPALAESKPICT